MEDIGLKFERKYYIKNLYHDKILNEFEVIEFHSASSFIEVIQKSWLEPLGKILIFNITDQKEYNVLREVLTKSVLGIENKIFLRIDDSQLFKDINKKIDFNCSLISKNPVYSENKWNKNHRVYKTICINGQNYQEKISSIINDTLFIFVELIIDYESFRSLLISNLEEISFWFGQLRVWESNKGSLEIFRTEKLKKKIFVKDNGKLYLGREINTLFWDLSIYGGKTGEEIPFKELNNLRQVIDLNEDAIYSDFNIKNYALIDWEYCSRSNFVNEIPFIVGYIQRCMYGL